MNEKILENVEQQMQNELEEKIAKVRRAAVVRVPDDFEGECTECSTPIPHGRLKTGAVTCLDCQQYLEKSSRHRKIGRLISNED